MKRVLGVVVGTLLGLSALASQASAEIFVADTENDLFFTNFENLWDSTGAWKAPTAAPVVGDYLAGIINVQNIDANSSTHFFQGPAAQISGVFAQKIVEIKTDGLGGPIHFTLGNPTITTFSKGGDSFSTGLASGEMFVFYLQAPATTLFTSGGPMATDVSKATDGTKLLTFGLDATDGAGLDGIFGTADDTGYMYSHPILGSGIPNGLAFGGMTVKTNATGFDFAGINDVNESEIGGTTLLNQLVFKSTFEVNQQGIAFKTASGLDCSLSSSHCSPWEFTSQDPAKVLPHVIPEVSSLWLLGMGLSGIGVIRRKKFFV